MEPQSTPNTHSSQYCLRVPDHSLDLETKPAKIEQQIETQARGPEVVQALRAMNVIDRPGDLPFHKHDVFHGQVHGVVPEPGIVVSNDHAVLLRSPSPALRSSCTKAFS